jgi:hypothetical protein
MKVMKIIKNKKDSEIEKLIRINEDNYELMKIMIEDNTAQ